MFRSFVVVACLATWPVSAAHAQPRSALFGITDNSFLVEEAFNQERGVFQHIFAVIRTRDGGWAGSFTQEWPVPGQRHQLSFTLPFQFDSDAFDLADVMLNYRLQLWTEGDRRPAFSPRISAVIASSGDRETEALGSGWQINLPVSKQAGRFFFHFNAGATWLKVRDDAAGAAGQSWTNTPSAAASVIFAVRPMFNLMLEVAGQSISNPEGPRENSATVVPGFRVGWNFGDRQLVVGVGVPITQGDLRDRGLLLYSSFELPFRK